MAFLDRDTMHMGVGHRICLCELGKVYMRRRPAVGGLAGWLQWLEGYDRSVRKSWMLERRGGRQSSLELKVAGASEAAGSQKQRYVQMSIPVARDILLTASRMLRGRYIERSGAQLRLR